MIYTSPPYKKCDNFTCSIKILRAKFTVKKIYVIYWF